MRIAVFLSTVILTVVKYKKSHRKEAKEREIMGMVRIQRHNCG